MKIQNDGDSLTLTTSEGVDVLRISALGGPMDDLLFNFPSHHDHMNRETLDEFQRYLINFMNTGYFDVEGG